MARPKAGEALTLEAVLLTATELLNERGREGLTLTQLAKRLNVKPPSLYNHVAGLNGLIELLRLRALHAMHELLAAAAVGRSGGDALTALCGAYRGFAASQPGAYALTVKAGTGPSAEAAEAAARSVEVVTAVLAGYGLTGERAVHATRVLRAALHGFVVLETSGGFGLPLDVDESFDVLVDALHDAMTGLAGDQA